MLHARIQDLQASTRGFSFLLTSSSPPSASSIHGLPLHVGQYMVQYNAQTQHWSYVLAHKALPSATVKVLGVEKVGHQSKYAISVKNTGNIPWNGAVVLTVNGKEVFSVQQMIDGGSTWHHTAAWTPESAGVVSLEIKAGSHTVWKATQSIAKSPTMRDSFLFHQGPWSDILDGFLMILLFFLLLLGTITIWYTARNKELN